MQRFLGGILVVMLWVVTGCSGEAPRIVVITSTLVPQVEALRQPSATPFITGTPLPTAPPLALSPVPAGFGTPTPNPTRPGAGAEAVQHVVQAGDTLTGIAAQYGVTVNDLIQTNQLANPNVISLGQVIRLPQPPAEASPSFKILPDSRLVRGPGSTDFDVAAFVSRMPGYIRNVSDEVTTRLSNGAGFEERLSAAEVIERVSLEFSVDARLLLAVLEYRAGWLSQPIVLAEEARTHPLIKPEDTGGRDRSGLYRQLIWAANALNEGYYGWKYRGRTTLLFEDGRRLRLGEGLNPATVGLQHFFSQHSDYADWLNAVGQAGFYQTYAAYFGYPFADAVEPLVPPNLTQPALTLPFAAGETWYYTGGPHGGWGNGGAWAALDFAPPDERRGDQPLCYLSQTPVRAVAPGVIARTDEGVVVLDLDGDADESTGWSILYLHVTVDEVIQAGTSVTTGDRLGWSSCAGGVSTATHLHIARRYNGEWLPADCIACLPTVSVPPFIMSGWRALASGRQLYQGFMQQGTTRIQAEQGRLPSANNRISW